MLDSPNEILRYWFGEKFEENNEMNQVNYIQSRISLWFGSTSREFDNIQIQNAALIERLARYAENSNEIDDDSWNSPHGFLAIIIVLDQFSRSVYRGTARAFTCDHLALNICYRLLNISNIATTEPFSPIESIGSNAGYRTMPSIFRLFVIVAIQHSEDLAAQKLGVWLASWIASDASPELVSYFANLKGFPMEHYDVIARFGRFPSRNDALVGTWVTCCTLLVDLYTVCVQDRISLPEEIEWLESPDCPAWAQSQRKQQQQLEAK